MALYCFVSQGDRACFCLYLLKAAVVPSAQASVPSEDILLCFSASPFLRILLLIAVGDGSSASDLYSLYYLLTSLKIRKKLIKTDLWKMFVTYTNNSLSLLLFV